MEIVATSRRQREFLKFIWSLATDSYLWGNPQNNDSFFKKIPQNFNFDLVSYQIMPFDSS